MHTRSKRYQRRQRARMRAARAPDFPKYENRLAQQVAAGMKKRRLVMAPASPESIFTIGFSV